MRCGLGGHTNSVSCRNKRTLWFAHLVGLLLLVFAFRGFAQSPPKPSTVEEPVPTGERALSLRELSPFEFPGTWEYNWGDSPTDALGRRVWALPHSHTREWTPLGRYEVPPGRQGRSWLWLRAELPAQPLLDPMLHILHLDQEIQVYMDGKLVYEWGDFSLETPKFLGFRGHLIRFPPDSAGKRIVLRVFSQHRNIGPAGPMRYGEHGTIIRQLFLTDLPRILVAGILALFSAMGFALFWLRRDERVFLAYGALALSGGVYILSQAQVRIFLFDWPLLVTHIELWSLQVTMLALCHFVELMFGQGPLRVLYYLRQIQWLYLCGSAGLVALGVVPLLKSLFPVQLLLFGDALFAVALPLYYSFRGNVEARIFATGFLAAGAVAVYDVLVALGVLSRAQVKLGHVGYALFFLTLGLILARRVLRAHERLKSYTAMLNLSLASSRVLVADERAQVALSELVRLLSARRAFLFLVREDNGQLEFAIGRKSDGESLTSVPDVDLVLVQHTLSVQRPAVRRSADRKSVLLVAPLTVRGQRIGVLYIESDVRRQGLHEEDLDVLSGLAHQVAIAIISARTLRLEMDAAMTQKRMQEQQFLLDAAVRMAAGDLSTSIVVPHGSAVSHLAAALESMRTDLLTKLLEYESKNREVQTLNEELRRQIAERSQRLMSAIIRSKGGKIEPLPDLTPGRLVVGRYKVVRKIGEGAMGVVHEVERIADGRHMAAKFVLRLSDKKSLLRFMREAQILARLRHPNLISITDVDMTAGGILFMMMELVIGGSLKFARRRFGEVRWALCVLRQIAEALSAIHTAGIVHRDLKPDNVLLAGGEGAALPVVKLVDFGVSLLMSKVQTVPMSRVQTQQGMAVGEIDPLESSRQMDVPSEYGDSSDDPVPDAFGDEDTADNPIDSNMETIEAPKAGYGPSVDENAPTLSGYIGGRQERTKPRGSKTGSTPMAHHHQSPEPLGAPPSESTGSGAQESVTQSGILIGTPMYMAPELWELGSHLAQPSSDLFSFGVIAFELLTGVLPFLTPPVFAVGQKQPVRIAKLASSRSELDKRLSSLVDACLSEDARARPSARVVAEQLREMGAPTPY